MSAVHTALDVGETVGHMVGGTAKAVGEVAGGAGVGLGAYETIDAAAHGDTGGAVRAGMATMMPLLGALAPMFGVTGEADWNPKNPDTGMTASQERDAGYQSSAPAPAPAPAPEQNQSVACPNVSQ